MSETENVVTASSPVDWDSVDLPKSKKMINYLRLKTGKTYTIRLFHKPHPVLRYYINGKSAICANADTCPVAIKRSQKPKSRYAILCIDREDKDVKVLEAPAGVFKDFRKLFDADGIEPGGVDSVDFRVKVTGEGLNTRYEVSYSTKPSPFTPEEKAKITAAIESGYKLSELFRPMDPAKIEAHLYPVGGTESVPQEVAAPTVTNSAAPTKDKEDFGWAN